MLNDNKSNENKQINVNSPLIKKIMIFNSIVLDIASIIGLFLIVFGTFHFTSIQDGLAFAIIFYPLVFILISFFIYGFTTLRLLTGKNNLLKSSIGWGISSFCGVCLMILITSLMYLPVDISKIVLLIIFVQILFNLVQLINIKDKLNKVK